MRNQRQVCCECVLSVCCGAEYSQGRVSVGPSVPAREGSEDYPVLSRRINTDTWFVDTLA